MIVSSSFTSEPRAQIDGRRYVTETHVDDVVGTVTFTYLAEVGQDYSAVMAARVLAWNANPPQPPTTYVVTNEDGTTSTLIA